MDINSRSFVLILVALVLVFRLTQTSLAHKQASRNLDVLKSYIDQGKDPPPELLAALRQPEANHRAYDWNLPKRNWIPFGLFAGLTLGLLSLGVAGDEGNPGLFFGLVMAGLAIGFLGNILSEQRQQNNRNDKRIPPP